MKQLLKILTVYLLAVTICHGEILVRENSLGSTIIDTKGGNVNNVCNQFEKYRKPIKILTCSSASCSCPLKYSDTCVYKNASLELHSMQHPIASIRNDWNIKFAQYYERIGLRALGNLYRTGFNHPNIVYRYTGLEFHKKFKVPLCKTEIKDHGNGFIIQ